MDVAIHRSCAWSTYAPQCRGRHHAPMGRPRGILGSNIPWFLRPRFLPHVQGGNLGGWVERTWTTNPKGDLFPGKPRIDRRVRPCHSHLVLGMGKTYMSLDELVRRFTRKFFTTPSPPSKVLGVWRRRQEHRDTGCEPKVRP